jgi:hypothetical protein
VIAGVLERDPGALDQVRVLFALGRRWAGTVDLSASTQFKPAVML